MTPQNLRGFAEKVALITDGANEIGRAVALQLALQGCYVVVGYADSSPDNERALSELKSIGTLADAVPVDFNSETGVENLFSAVETAYARLDLLVNTTAFASTQTFAATNDDIFAQTMNLNLTTAFRAAQKAIELMRSRPAAAIVNVASAAGLHANTGNAAFVAANAAVIGLTKALARELAPKIRVNCVAVGGAEEIDTASQTTAVPTAESKQKSLEALLKPRSAVAADDVARAIVYLLSADAAALTGQVLSVGGRTRML